jgi:hypothetical protein
MLISAQDYSNNYYPGDGWAFGYTSQQLVTAEIVEETGGTYE